MELEKSAPEPPISEPVMPEQDAALPEQLAALTAAHTSLKKRHADTITRHENLQSSYDVLLEQSKAESRKLASLESSNTKFDYQGKFDYLEQQIAEMNELISTQEAQIEDERKARERQEKQLTKLKTSAGSSRELENEMQELREENVALKKKANTVENLQKKIDMQSGLEKTNVRLIEQIEVLESNQQAYDQKHAENDRYKKTLEEYERLFTTYERETIEATAGRKLLEEQLKEQQRTIDELQAKIIHDEGYIAEQQEQLKMNANINIPRSPSPSGESHRGALMSLEDELNQVDDPAINYPLQISRLQATIQSLKDSSGGITHTELRKEIEAAETQRKELLEKYTKLKEEYSLSQRQLSALMLSNGPEMLVKAVALVINVGPYQILTEKFNRDTGSAETHKAFVEANSEIDRLKRKITELNLEISSRDRELTAAKADRMYPHFALHSQKRAS